MDRLPTILRFALLALVVLAGVAPGGRGASACSMRMPDGSACGVQARCGCCTARPSTVKVAPVVTVSPTLQEIVLVKVGRAPSCVLTCGCEEGPPTAPGPRGSLGAGSSLSDGVRFAPALVLFASLGGLDRTPGLFLVAERAPGAPIYLRCERFLT